MEACCRLLYTLLYSLKIVFFFTSCQPNWSLVSDVGGQEKVQSNSIIVESIIVENSIIVDNLPSTEDFYLIKIQNSRNSKIVEVFLGKVA